jgi:general secretion pathway protein G
MRVRSKVRSRVGKLRVGRLRVVRLKVRNPRFCNRGFTLIEMLVVISIIMVLLAIAVPNYTHNVLLAKEAKLHQNLTTLNKVIQEYSLDKKKAPQSLDDLVTAGYIKFIPDDITGSNTTWQTDPEAQDADNTAWDPNQPGIGSVHSGSNETSSDGQPYSSWTH